MTLTDEQFRRVHAATVSGCTLRQVEAALMRHRAVQIRNGVSGDCRIGHPDKSALLIRILDGLPIYQKPPPRAFGYPAYHRLDASMDEELRVDAHFMPSGDVLLDQTRAIVVDRNDAAVQVEAQLREPFDAAAFRAACDRSPKWAVQFPHWPAFELGVRRMDTGFGRLLSIVQRGERQRKNLTLADVRDGNWDPQPENSGKDFGGFTAMTWTLSRKDPMWLSIDMIMGETTDRESAGS